MAGAARRALLRHPQRLLADRRAARPAHPAGRRPAPGRRAHRQPLPARQAAAGAGAPGLLAAGRRGLRRRAAGALVRPRPVAGRSRHLPPRGPPGKPPDRLQGADRHHPQPGHPPQPRGQPGLGDQPAERAAAAARPTGRRREPRLPRPARRPAAARARPVRRRGARLRAELLRHPGRRRGRPRPGLHRRRPPGQPAVLLRRPRGAARRRRCRELCAGVHRPRGDRLLLGLRRRRPVPRAGAAPSARRRRGGLRARHPALAAGVGRQRPRRAPQLRRQARRQPRPAPQRRPGDQGQQQPALRQQQRDRRLLPPPVPAARGAGAVLRHPQRPGLRLDHRPDHRQQARRAHRRHRPADLRHALDPRAGRQPRPRPSGEGAERLLPERRTGLRRLPWPWRSSTSTTP
ncbi:hypothetical protein OF001_U180057 [Pseudomonas sp. OF001]|nr:hypothetical protein OF001_U180057 [Pseudomonas sp. OF001]